MTKKPIYQRKKTYTNKAHKKPGQSPITHANYLNYIIMVTNDLTKYVNFLRVFVYHKYKMISPMIPIKNRNSCFVNYTGVKNIPIVIKVEEH